MSDKLSVEEFLERRFDLPDGGRWTELEAGEPVQFHPPDQMHGNVVLNLSKMLAAHVGEFESTQIGALCFEKGLIVEGLYDTVRYPTVCYFSRYAEVTAFDDSPTPLAPIWIADIASTNDRRRQMRLRVEQFLAGGTETVWIIDTVARTVQVCAADQPLERYGEAEHLRGEGDDVLSALCIRVGDLFVEPSWWSAPR